MKKPNLACKYCRQPMQPKTTRAEFCSPKCRVYYHREVKETPFSSLPTLRDPESHRKPPAGLTLDQRIAWYEANER